MHTRHTRDAPTNLELNAGRRAIVHDKLRGFVKPRLHTVAHVGDKSLVRVLQTQFEGQRELVSYGFRSQRENISQ